MSNTQLIPAYELNEHDFLMQEYGLTHHSTETAESRALIDMFNVNLRASHQNASATLNSEALSAYGCPDYAGGTVIIYLHL